MKIKEAQEKENKRIEAALSKRSAAEAGIEVTARQLSELAGPAYDEEVAKGIMDAARSLMQADSSPVSTVQAHTAPIFNRQPAVSYDSQQPSFLESERLESHPLVDFIQSDNQRLEILPGLEIYSKDISEQLKNDLLKIVKKGGFHQSFDRAEAAQAMPLTFLHVGPSVTLADRCILASLIPTSQGDRIPGVHELLIPEQYRLYYKRESDRGKGSRTSVNGLTTVFNGTSTSEAGARILIAKSKGEETSTVALFSSLPVSKVSKDTFLSNIIPFPLSGGVVGVTLAGLVDYTNTFYRGNHGEFYYSQIVVLPYQAGDYNQEGRASLNPVNTVSVNTVETLDEYKLQTYTSDVLVVFTAPTVNQMSQNMNKLKFNLDDADYPKLVFLGEAGRSLAEQVLKANKDKSLLVFLASKDKSHSDDADYPLAFDGEKRVRVYPYYYKKQLIGAGMKPYEGNVR